MRPTGFIRSALASGVGSAIMTFARLLTGAQPRWIGCEPGPAQRIYLPNHASHGDFVLVWSSLPRRLRACTRPVAGSDYWDRGGLRSFVIRDVFNAVLIDREAGTREADPIGTMQAALDEGSSLILFPEGTRNTTDERLLPFKSGVFHLARRRPEVELVPVWIENLNRVLPKGEVLPVPLLCTVNFGTPIRLAEGESKSDFVGRARSALLELAERCGPRGD
jgi:1-acyl-sn-glycerol-3-phosphate acyltransferase